MTISFDKEETFDTFLQEHIVPFWQDTVQQDYFIGENNAVIRYCFCLCDNPVGTIVVSPGRIEGYIKYQELMYDLYTQNYNVYVIDHRGQGFSKRLIEHAEKGYVESFNYYVRDFAFFIEEVIVKQTNTPLYILAHSMGSAIATRYMQRKTAQQLIKAAALCSPMYGIYTGKLPLSLAKGLLALSHNINRLLHRPPAYFMGQMNYHNVPFMLNPLTHSEPRYQWFRELYETYPEAKLGGVTTHWLKAALTGMERIFFHADDFKTPAIVLQASQDIVVDNSAQHAFVKRVQHNPHHAPISLTTYEHAKHEILFEKDNIRTPALSSILALFSNHR
ncbi:alpha/beta fold hydrolase [Flocculibacter collagenilyticus]|uniref:alpha/beta fold hydrolase n=1 Tax=Flocculibacter collagenilyticus TaxID=2744479 RepID=UPI0018F7714E|nr:alpha/beta fold hydrolase [Flocculibacter collagenilyticus]